MVLHDVDWFFVMCDFNHRAALWSAVNTVGMPGVGLRYVLRHRGGNDHLFVSLNLGEEAFPTTGIKLRKHIVKDDDRITGR